ncbi:MAG: acyclic terpene utilization AtuA family protein [Caulobacter sp.]|nr:acyclic terpene utilization AtuA family protein [Caulobacter sp.]
MNSDNPTVVVVPVGALGAGIKFEHLEAGLAAGAHAMAMDAGSTDSGPAALATGLSKYSRDAVKSDLKLLVAAQAKWGVPLLVGSCGTSGCDMAVDWTRDIVLEICQELNLTPTLAMLYSEQEKSVIRDRLAEGRVLPLAPLGALTEDTLKSCEHVVALMGPEPYIAALEAGADIVLGGRTTDTAVIAAVPIMRGAGVGPAWHAGKIAECGGLCTITPFEGGVVIRVGADAFEIEPLSATNRCTPYSVSAHMLYENSDPYLLHEPGGVLDVSQARYEPKDDRIVRVSGSRFIEKPYTMKLEGAANGPFQSIMLVGITDPQVLAALDKFLADMHATLVGRVKAVLGDAAGEFDISLRPYGWNAVLGLPVTDGFPTREIGLLLVATAETKELALRIAKICNPYFFHFPMRRDKELPSYGFPFSPAEIELGRTYAFVLNHVVETTDGHELVRRTILPLALTTGAREHAQAE